MHLSTAMFANVKSVLKPDVRADRFVPLIRLKTNASLRVKTAMSKQRKNARRMLIALPQSGAAKAIASIVNNQDLV